MIARDCSTSFRVATALIGVAIATSATTPVLGQTLLTPFMPEVEEFLGTSDDRTQPAGSGGGYWIVSSHMSTQSFADERPVFRPYTLRHECSLGGETRHEYAEMCQSLVPGVPVCIFVHGSFVTWQDVIEQSHLTHDWINTAALGQPMQLINFAWPSGRPINIARIHFDATQLGRRAERNGYYLAELIRSVPPECPISLIGHSHGTRVISSGLHLLGGGTVQSIAYPAAGIHGRRIRTVFAASAIHNNWLNPGERYGCALHVTEGLLNLKNCHDPALWLYPLQYPFSGHAFGATGLSPLDRYRLGNKAGRVTEISVADDLGLAHMWPNYTSRPHLAMLIRNYVYFPDAVPPMSAHAESQNTADQPGDMNH